ncbi:MAG: 16S rRNA (adenine(1518)-N(6)/adenine(1519)-N(6))-dimethyltransferase, partial [Deltaproteobacteria bacterium]|nr:16S rRNA (adenine(1518)-N(6)/adenine(1519)-N(6))-dimethyltransferase [Deltaproteobacteria bacterium]
VCHGDFLKMDLAAVCDADKKSIVVGNLPYNVSSQILIRLFQNNNLFNRLFLMFQREVAIRCLAGPGGKDYGMLSLWTQLFSRAKKLFNVPANAFLPRPKVVSTFLQLDCPGRDYREEAEFIKFAKVLFSQRRKKASTVLKTSKTGASPTIRAWTDKRPEQLSLAELRQIWLWASGLSL